MPLLLSPCYSCFPRIKPTTQPFFCCLNYQQKFPHHHVRKQTWRKKKRRKKKNLWRHFLLGNSHNFQPLKATSKPIKPSKPPFPKKVLLERRRGELYEGTRRATSQIFWVPGNKKTRVLLHMEHRNSRFSSPQKLGKKSCCWFLGVLLEMRVLFVFIPQKPGQRHDF